MISHIYVHIPFCLKKCGYCDFYSIVDMSLVDRFIGALCKEIDTYGRKYGGNKIDTVYFGGGTPSLLEVHHLELILNRLASVFSILDGAEISLEANPETLNPERLLGLKSVGFNRLSVGVQSFIDEDLAYLGRVHNSNKARFVLESAAKIFQNISIDLIFGLSGDDEAKLKHNIKEAMAFSPGHLSYYELTYEKGTPLYERKRARSKERETNNEEQSDEANLYLYIIQQLKTHGLIQYEISNYAKTGHECRHNLAYWSDKSYLGLGPAAHSYDRDEFRRWANKRDLMSYISGDCIDFTENASPIDRIISGLRKTEGIPVEYISDALNSRFKELVDCGLLQISNGKIAYSEKGRLLSNRVLLEIMG